MTTVAEIAAGLTKAQRHNLKCWPGPFAAMRRGEKTAEFRADDRGFAVGDYLVLHEWCPVRGRFEGPKIVRRITHVLRGGFGVPDGYAMLSLASDEAETLRSLWQDAIDDHMTSAVHHPEHVLIPAVTMAAVRNYLKDKGTDHVQAGRFETQPTTAPPSALAQ